MACWEFYAAKNATKTDFFVVQIINIYHCNQLLVIDNSVIITITISIVITVVIIINGTIKKQEGLAGCNKRAPGGVVVLSCILELVPLLPPPLYLPLTLFVPSLIPLGHHCHCQYIKCLCKIMLCKRAITIMLCKRVIYISCQQFSGLKSFWFIIKLLAPCSFHSFHGLKRCRWLIKDSKSKVWGRNFWSSCPFLTSDIWCKNEGRIPEASETLRRFGGSWRNCNSYFFHKRKQDHCQAAPWVFSIFTSDLNCSSILATSSW